MPPSTNPPTVSSDADALVNLGDVELLELFVHSKSSEAFAAMVCRYGPMVKCIVDRTLSDRHLAEDAFQKTFLQLHISAQKIRNPNSLAAWLHGVAYRVARSMETQLHRFHVRHSNDPMTITELVDKESSDILAQLSNYIQLATLDDELSRLPVQQSTPIILHYIEGKSVLQIADEMELSITAVEGRLKRARKTLRTRLAMRGVSFSLSVGILSSAKTSTSAAEAVPWIHGFLNRFANGQLNSYTDSIFSVRPQSRSFNWHGNTFMKFVPYYGVPSIAVVFCMAFLGYLGLSLIPFDLNHGHPSAPFISSTVAEDDTLIATTSQKLHADDTGRTEKTNATDLKEGTGDSFAEEINSTNARSSTSEPDNSKFSKEFAARKNAEEQIQQSLFQKREISFTQQPLSQVMKFFAQEYSIPIFIDESSLTDESISPDEPVTITTSPIQFRSALHLILKPLALTYSIRDEVLVISSAGTAHLSTKFYDTSSFTNVTFSADRVIELIKKHVHPESWDAKEHLTPGTISETGGSIAVRATTEVHLDVAEFLMNLRQLPVTNNKKQR